MGLIATWYASWTLTYILTEPVWYRQAESWTQSDGSNIGFGFQDLLLIVVLAQQVYATLVVATDGRRLMKPGLIVAGSLVAGIIPFAAIAGLGRASPYQHHSRIGWSIAIGSVIAISMMVWHFLWPPMPNRYNLRFDWWMIIGLFIVGFFAFKIGDYWPVWFRPRDQFFIPEFPL